MSVTTNFPLYLNLLCPRGVEEKNMMNSEQQYITLYNDNAELIKSHSSDVLNAVRDEAFENFRRMGFPSKKVERYKYTDVAALFAPDYGLNLNRLDIPVDPYEAFRCDVPNLSTSLYFVVNDQFYTKALPEGHSRRRNHRRLVSPCGCRTSRHRSEILCQSRKDEGRCHHGP